MADNVFAVRLRDERKKAGLTQEELAGRLGVTGSMVAQYESTSDYARNPKPETIERFAEALDIPISALLGVETHSADIATAVHAEWYLLDDCANAGLYCSACNRRVHREEFAYKKLRSKYCPHCGARMDGGKCGMDERQILGRAISFYGSEIQRVVAVEELSELQKELCKSLRSGADRVHIAEEIADVQIMLEQMMMLYECHEDVAIWRRKKVERLRERLAHDGGM